MRNKSCSRGFKKVGNTCRKIKNRLSKKNITSEQKKNISRAIVVLVLGMIIAMFLTFNSTERFSAGILYMILGAASVLSYLVWDKF